MPVGLNEARPSFGEDLIACPFSRRRRRRFRHSIQPGECSSKQPRTSHKEEEEKREEKIFDTTKRHFIRSVITNSYVEKRLDAGWDPPAPPGKSSAGGSKGDSLSHDGLLACMHEV
jgi:hypothetical protein